MSELQQPQIGNYMGKALQKLKDEKGQNVEISYENTIEEAKRLRNANVAAAPAAAPAAASAASAAAPAAASAASAAAPATPAAAPATTRMPVGPPAWYKRNTRTPEEKELYKAYVARQKAEAEKAKREAVLGKYQATADRASENAEKLKQEQEKLQQELRNYDTNFNENTTKIQTYLDSLEQLTTTPATEALTTIVRDIDNYTTKSPLAYLLKTHKELLTKAKTELENIKAFTRKAPIRYGRDAKFSSAGSLKGGARNKSKNAHTRKARSTLTM